MTPDEWYVYRSMDVRKLFDCAIKLETENLNVYGVYEHANAQLGIKKLIKGVLQESKGHVKKIEDFLKEARSLQESFVPSDTAAVDFECGDEPLVFDALLSNTSLFGLIIERGRRLSEIYGRLSELAVSEGDRHFFRSCADDEIRHMSWAQDHLDLESMLTSP